MMGASWQTTKKIIIDWWCLVSSIQLYLFPFKPRHWPGCGSVWYFQSILVNCRYFAAPGTSDQAVSSSPASNNNTVQSAISDSLAATTAPADPPPTTMKSYSVHRSCALQEERERERERESDKHKRRPIHHPASSPMHNHSLLHSLLFLRDYPMEL